MTATRSKTRTEGEVHILDFAIGGNARCALTVLIKDFRFHIIASPENLGDPDPVRGTRSQYYSLVGAVEAQGKEDSSCGTRSNPKYSSSRRRDRRHGMTSHGSQKDDNDSGVDIGENSHCLHGSKAEQSTNFISGRNPEEDLQDWMLQPLREIFDKLPSETGLPEPQSLYEWHSGPTYFYRLFDQGDELRCVELEAQNEMEEQIRNLMPRIPLRKYIKALEIPHFKADSIRVLTASNESGRYRPSRVQAGEDIYHFKAVDPSQPQTTGRELRLLKEIERKGLHKKLRVPVIAGLVGWQDSNSEIMGFLQTIIEDPTPLTLMFDSDVVEDKREKWATETKRMIKLLHDNDIVWGDAKADNFMVDRYGDLWMIDFGGSYTDGWVDPELMETEEGDDMGVKKIVKALEDPEANTYDPRDSQDRKCRSVSEKRPQEQGQERRCLEEQTDGSRLAKRRKIS